MRVIHAIAGVPRSGSTLLCNILNQNPLFTATDTSPIPELLGLVSSRLSASPEVQGLLLQDSRLTEDRIRGMMRGMINAWYKDVDYVFDKSRGWSFQASLLADLYPDTKVIVVVRDLRSVFASIEKQHRKTPFFDTAANAIDKTILQRADIMFSVDGMIGTCAVGLQDLMARMPNRVHVIRYESFSNDPRTEISDLYDFLELSQFEHDFENIENVSKEPDHLYLNKFPHKGDGKVQKTDRNEWQQYLTADLAQMIHARYPDYNKAFGY